MSPPPPPRAQDVYLKGVGFDACVSFAQHQLGVEAGERILRRTEAKVGLLQPYRLASARVPLDVTSALFHEVAQEVGGAFSNRRARLAEMGAFVAEQNLNGVFKVVLSFIGSPERLARRLPSMWTTYFPNVQVDVDLDRLVRGEVRSVVHRLERLHYINGVARGWLSYAFRLVGAARVEVIEAGLERGTFAPERPLEYTIRWT